MVATTDFIISKELYAQQPSFESSTETTPSIKPSARVSDPAVLAEVGAYASKALDKLYDSSSLFETRPNLKKLSVNDVVVGSKLGEGGFCVVHECTIENSTYAVKSLKHSTLGNASRLKVAAADLVVEAQYLSALDHPNIVKTHGVLEGSVEDTVGEYFIVIDRLEETLEQRLGKWRVAQEEEQHNNRRSKDGGKNQQRQALNERLRVALEIANVLCYLHKEKDIIYRDLKAENVGFDQDGNVKLFDFGLAKELKNKDKSSNGKFKLSGNTGSQAYMAPEVAKGWKYDRTVDAYSFGILLWEICAMENAFYGYSNQEFMRRVVQGEERPKLQEWWPVELQWLMKKCWGFFSNSRPDMETVKETLEEILGGEETEEEEELRTVRSFRFGSRRSNNKDNSNSSGGRSQKSQQEERPVRIWVHHPRLLISSPKPHKPRTNTKALSERKRSQGVRMFGHRFI